MNREKEETVRRRSRFWWRVVFLQLALILPLLLVLLLGYRINLEGSMPRGIYRIKEGRIRIGDPVLVSLGSDWQRIAWNRGYVSKRSLPLLKFVCGVPGDRYRIGESGIEIDGRLIPDTAPLDRDSKGREMPFTTREGTLAEGEYLVVSNGMANGYDSRYFGVIPASRILDRMAIVHLFDAREGEPSPPFH